MTKAPSSTSVHTPTDASPKKINAAWLICLLLAYTAAAQYAAGPGLVRLVAENAEYNRFSSQDVLITFMRVGVLIWSIVASFLQALALRLIYKAIVRGPSPTLRVSWFWVLLGQIPFILTVLVMGLFLEPSATNILGQTWLRILFGAVASGVYVGCARKVFGASNPRLTVLCVIFTLVNSILLVSGQSA